MCIRVKWNIKMSDTSHLKYPVWLCLHKWSSHFTSEGYILIPLVRFCTNSTSAPSLIPELEQGLWDWVWDHSWGIYSNCSSMWKEQDWVGVTWDSAFIFSQDWMRHMEIIPKQVLGCAECPFCLWTSSGKHTEQCSDLCISIGVSGTACFCCWNRKESYLEPDQSRDKESLQRSEYPTDGVHWGGCSLFGISRWS